MKGLSPPTISRLRRGWEAEYAEWRQRGSRRFRVLLHHRAEPIDHRMHALAHARDTT